MILLLSPHSGGSLGIHNGCKFSTPDHGPRKDLCAAPFESGWWYYEDASEPDECLESNLNGRYYTTGEDDYRQPYAGVMWSTLRGDGYSLKGSQMKIRVPN